MHVRLNTVVVDLSIRVIKHINVHRFSVPVEPALVFFGSCEKHKNNKKLACYDYNRIRHVIQK